MTYEIEIKESFSTWKHVATQKSEEAAIKKIIDLKDSGMIVRSTPDISDQVDLELTRRKENTK